MARDGESGRVIGDWRVTVGVVLDLRGVTRSRAHDMARAAVSVNLSHMEGLHGVIINSDVAPPQIAVQ